MITTAEQTARWWHEISQNLALSFGYRHEPRGRWEDLPKHEQALLLATADEVLRRLIALFKHDLDPRTRRPDEAT
jgi:hypothetical protein